MRDSNNIIKYGFLIFLLSVGVGAIFIKNDNLLNGIKNLSIPVFLLSLSLLLLRSNKYIRKRIHDEIDILNNKNSKDNVDKLIELNEIIIENEDTFKNFYYQLIDNSVQIKISLKNRKKLTFLYQLYFRIDFFTLLFNK